MNERPVDSRELSRRQFVASSALAGLGLVACGASEEAPPAESVSDQPLADAMATEPPVSRVPARLETARATALEARFRELVEEHDIPGCAAALIRDSEPVWTGGFGFADLDARVPMTADTLLNVGSVTKTVTTTAVLQLSEQGRLDLDADVSGRLGFSVRNPRHPDVPITARQLLTHRSSVMDGPAYDASYACGDRIGTLGAWVEEYFKSAELDDNFHLWAPGELDPPESPRAYSNVGYGLLGHLIEAISGRPFEGYCRDYIFAPLGMSASGFRIDGIDVDRHAVPYSRLPGDFDAEQESAEERLGRFTFGERQPVPGEFFPHCLYSFATPPDGLLRTSANDLSRFLAAWVGHGQAHDGDGESIQILGADTVATALADDHYGRMLCWDRIESLPGEPLIFHDGGDPGISALIAFRPTERSGLLLIINTSDAGGMFGDSVRALLAAL